MRIKEVWIKNFRGYGENLREEDRFYKFTNLDRELVLFAGFNGFGKTSFFDAVEWCLTDKISRIERIKVFLKQDNLKKSSYLKFHNKTEKDNMREVEVILYFSDDTYIKRTSKCDSIDEERYSSEFFTNNIKMSESENELLLNQKDNICDVMNTNFLGQENINRIIRATEPSQRTDELLKLLGLNSIKEVIDKSQVKNISGAINKINLELAKINEYKIKINSLFERNEWGTFEEYKEKVQNQIQYFISEKEKFEYYDEWKVLDKVNEKECEIVTYVEVIKELVIKCDEVREKKSKFKSSLDILVEEFLIKKMLELYNEMGNIEYLKKYNIKELAEIDYLDKIEYFKKTSKTMSEEIESLEKLKDIWNKFKNKRKNKIFDDNLLIEFMQKCKKSSEVSNLSKKYLYNNQQIYILNKLINRKKWRKLINSNNKYLSNIQKVTEIIKNKKENIINISNINKEYSQILMQVKNYINQQDIDYCPICYNDNFSKDEKEDIFRNEESSNKDKLLNIIDRTIVGNSSNVGSIQKELKGYEEILTNLENLYKEKVENEYISIFSNLREIYNELYDELIIKLQSFDECYTNHIKYYVDRRLEVKEIIDNYKRIYKLIMNEEYEKGKEKEINEITNESINKKLAKMKSNYFEKYNATSIDKAILTNRLEELKGNRNYDDTRNMLSIKKEMDEYQKVYEMLEEIIPYEFKKTEKELFDNYLEYIAKEKSLIEKLSELKDYKKLITDINRNASGYQQEMVEKRLINNSLIQHIYEKINPHPFFRELKFDYVSARGGKKWTNIVDNDNSNIFLDHIFSSAQLNVLALSIFLALAISQRISTLNQIFLDDPIQSMDDVNILSFIDLLRDIVSSTKINSNIVLSTHDNNFARLLAIKMRNKDVRIFEFIGYGIEGPKIKYI